MGTLKRSLLSAYAGYAFRSLYLLILIPVYARTLGPSAYGLVMTAMAVQNIVWAVQNWGFSFGGARNIAASTTHAQWQAEYARQFTARLIMTAPAVIVGICAVLGSPLLVQQPLLATLAIACGIVSGFNLGWYFQGRLDFTTPVLIEGAGCVMTLLMVLFLVKGPHDVHWVMVSLLIPGVLSLALAYRRAGREMRLRLAPSAQALLTIRQCAPLFVSIGSAALMTVVGTYALSAASTPDQVAHFGTAEKVVVTLLGLLGPVGQVLLSWFTSQLQHGGSAAADAVTKSQFKAIRVVTAGGALATLAAATVLPPALSLWLGPRYEAVGHLLLLLSPLLVIGSFNSAVAVYVLVPQGREGLVSRINVGAAALGIGAVYAGAWVAGAPGAALARVATDLGISLCYGLVLRSTRRLAASAPQARMTA